jgi:hypothetical protein
MSSLIPPSKEGIRRALERLALLKYFPASNPVVFEEVSAILLDRCKSDQQLEATVSGILSTSSEWPGPASFRESLAYAWQDAFGPKASSAGTNSRLVYLDPDDTSEDANGLRAEENRRAALRGEPAPFPALVDEPTQPGPPGASGMTIPAGP